MNKQLIYSILQYKHSPVLRESINVGVLFYFPDEEQKLHFHLTDATRIKPIYKDFDAKYFNCILHIIKKNIETFTGDLYAEKLLNDNLKDFIHSYLLKNDDTALQFSDLHSVLNIYSNAEKAVEEYTRLLLPLNVKKDVQNIKHDEKFIVKKFHTRLLSRNAVVAERVQRDVEVKTDVIDIRFDVAWQNGSLNLVKPLSFDLQDSLAIQRKTAEYCSYLNWLNDYTKKNNCRVDLLLAEPQDRKLVNVYNKSVKLLQEVDSNKKIVPFEEIDEYTDKAVQYLLSL